MGLTLRNHNNDLERERQRERQRERERQTKKQTLNYREQTGDYQM